MNDSMIAISTTKRQKRFLAITMVVAFVTIAYIAWIVLAHAWHPAHLFWFAFGGYIAYLQWHVENELRIARDHEFRALTREWVARHGLSSVEPDDVLRSRINDVLVGTR